MSDDLIKRMEAWAQDIQLGGDAQGADLDIKEAAARIRELEAERDKLSEALEVARDVLRFYAWENQTRPPNEGPWGVNSRDFGYIALIEGDQTMSGRQWEDAHAALDKLREEARDLLRHMTGKEQDQ